MGRCRRRRLGNRPRRRCKGCAQGEGACSLRGLRPAEGLGPVSVQRRRKEAQMMGLLNTIVRFPNSTFERLALSEAPEVGKNIDAREARWRITKVRLPWGLDQPGDVVYDIDVEPALPIPPSKG
jgi:hypothetical protein